MLIYCKWRTTQFCHQSADLQCFFGGCSHCGLAVDYRISYREVASSTHTRSTASNLEQVDNLLCAQANSASYTQRDGKWVIATATGWRPSVVDWAMMCLLAASWVQLSVNAGNLWPHNALRHHWLMPISCHVLDCKALLVTNLTHGAITSVQTFTFTFHCNTKVKSIPSPVSPFFLSLPFPSLLLSPLCPLFSAVKRIALIQLGVCGSNWGIF